MAAAAAPETELIPDLASFLVMLLFGIPFVPFSLLFESNRIHESNRIYGLLPSPDAEFEFKLSSPGLFQSFVPPSVEGGDRGGGGISPRTG